MVKRIIKLIPFHVTSTTGPAQLGLVGSLHIGPYGFSVQIGWGGRG